jgi:hypothetical protein
MNGRGVGAQQFRGTSLAAHQRGLVRTSCVCEALALVGDSSLAGVDAKRRSDRTGVDAGRGGCMMEARSHLDCMPQR